MTDQPASGTPSPGGSPGGSAPSPAGTAPGNAGGFVAQRTAQLAASMQQPAPSDNAPAPDAGGGPQQQQPAAPAKIKIGDAEYDVGDVQSAIAERAEAAVRKSGLPKSPDGYEVKNSENFQLPEGVKFEFDRNSPSLAAARKFALDNNLTQQQFSGMLDLFVASKSGELLDQVRAREANLAQLGVAAPTRIQAISLWLKSVAGKDGADVANFISQYPSAPVVRALESVIRRFSSQGDSGFSQSYRAEQEDPGKIPGYENMNFVQRRVHQMSTMLQQRPGGYRGDGGRRGE